MTNCKFWIMTLGIKGLTLGFSDWHWVLVIYNQTVTWTAFAILAIFFASSHSSWTLGLKSKNSAVSTLSNFIKSQSKSSSSSSWTRETECAARNMNMQSEKCPKRDRPIALAGRVCFWKHCFSCWLRIYFLAIYQVLLFVCVWFICVFVYLCLCVFVCLLCLCLHVT